MTNDQGKQLTVLIVDDIRENIEILMEIIDDLCDVAVALDGVSALEIIKENAPDLILLDIMMPKMDGYEVCRILKRDMATRDIPIIFISALESLQAEEKGLVEGAIDYITKPFNPSIVRARIKNHLAWCEAEKVKKGVEQIIRHDMKNPLMAIINAPQLIMMTEDLSDPSVGLLKTIENSGKQILSLINRSMDIFKIEQGLYDLTPEAISLLPILDGILKELQLHGEKSVEVLIELDGRRIDGDEKFTVAGEALLCHMLFANLLKNAWEASESGETITISLKKDEDRRVVIHNRGTVPKQIRDRFFEKYSTFGKPKGSGLGTYISAMITKKLGGTIQMESSPKEGTTIAVCLPVVSDFDGGSTG